jgi:hypothetical protein
MTRNTIALQAAYGVQLPFLFRAILPCLITLAATAPAQDVSS